MPTSQPVWWFPGDPGWVWGLFISHSHRLYEKPSSMELLQGVPHAALGTEAGAEAPLLPTRPVWRQPRVPHGEALSECHSSRFVASKSRGKENPQHHPFLREELSLPFPSPGPAAPGPRPCHAETPSQQGQAAGSGVSCSQASAQGVAQLERGTQRVSQRLGPNSGPMVTGRGHYMWFCL